VSLATDRSLLLLALHCVSARERHVCEFVPLDCWQIKTTLNYPTICPLDLTTVNVAGSYNDDVTGEPSPYPTICPLDLTTLNVPGSYSDDVTGELSRYPTICTLHL
jgi:hypothetical protein